MSSLPRPTNLLGDEHTPSSNERLASIPDQVWTTTESSSTSHTSVSQASTPDYGYEADNEDSGDEENLDDNESLYFPGQDDDTTSVNTVSTDSAPVEEYLEATPHQQPGDNPQGSADQHTSDLVSSPSFTPGSEVDVEELLLNACEPRGFYWNTSDAGIR